MQHQHIAQQPGKLAQQRGRVFTVHPERGESLERVLRLVPDDVPQQLGDAPVPGEPHRGVDRVHIDVCTRRALVQKAQRVAQAALGHAGDQLGGLVCQLHMLARGDRL